MVLIQLVLCSTDFLYPPYFSCLWWRLLTACLHEEHFLQELKNKTTLWSFTLVYKWLLLIELRRCSLRSLFCNLTFYVWSRLDPMFKSKDYPQDKFEKQTKETVVSWTVFILMVTFTDSKVRTTFHNIINSESTSRYLSFEWSHSRVSLTYLKVRTTFHNIINRTKWKHFSISFIWMVTH